MSRVALLCYHKNAASIYPKAWVDKYRDSIQDQTFQGFEIFEHNYGGTNERIFEHSYFESFPYPTFVHALNYLLDKCFSNGYDYVLNSNLDDWYNVSWCEKILESMKDGYDLATSNFCLVSDDKIIKYHQFHQLDIVKELNNGHNPVAHPAICYNRKFWLTNRYNPDEIPFEDMKLWIRALKSGSKIIIRPENLLYHRIHQNAVCRSDNK